MVTNAMDMTIKSLVPSAILRIIVFRLQLNSQRLMLTNPACRNTMKMLA